MYNTVCHHAHARSWVVLGVASSGISALLIIGGRTAHSMFKIPVQGLDEDSFCAIPKESQRAELIRHTRLIIWDEAGPQHRNAPEALDRTCRDLRDNNHPFGGITVVFGGDFQQTLPVVKNGTRDDIVNATLQQSYLWQYIHILHLRTNMRLLGNDTEPDSQEIAFAEWLLQVGHGYQMTDDINEIKMPPETVCSSTQQLIDFIYASVCASPPPPPEYFLNRSILAARNIDVSDTNDAVLQRMSGDAKTYISADTIIEEAGADILQQNGAPPVPVEFLRSINSASLPPGELVLKIGCPIILLRNLAPSQGLCNGTRMVIKRMSDRVLEVVLIGGDHHGKKLCSFHALFSPHQTPRISQSTSDVANSLFGWHLQ